MNKMLGFILEQPLHKTLRQMRIATIVLLFVSVDIMYRLVGILENNSEMSSAQTVAAVGALAATVLTTIWKGIANLSEPHKSDD